MDVTSRVYFDESVGAALSAPCLLRTRKYNSSFGRIRVSEGGQVGGRETLDEFVGYSDELGLFNSLTAMAPYTAPSIGTKKIFATHD